LCGSRKYPYPHHRGSLEILRGREGVLAKIFKGMYEPKREFPEGWGAQTKNPLWGENGYFLENHINSYSALLFHPVPELFVLHISFFLFY